MYDVVILPTILSMTFQTLDIANGVFDDRGVVSWKVKVLRCIFIDNRVYFHNSGLNAVSNERGWRSTYS